MQNNISYISILTMFQLFRLTFETREKNVIIKLFILEYKSLKYK